MYSSDWATATEVTCIHLTELPRPKLLIWLSYHDRLLIWLSYRDRSYSSDWATATEVTCTHLTELPRPQLLIWLSYHDRSYPSDWATLIEVTTYSLPETSKEETTRYRGTTAITYKQSKHWQHWWIDWLSVRWENGPERGLMTVSFNP